MTSLFSILYVVHNEEQQDLPESAIEREQARLFKDGDRGAFDWFFNRYREPVYRFCYKHLKNEEAALDAVQESFLRLLGMRERLKPGQGVKNYLFTIALNYCYDVLRKEQFRKTGSLTPLVEDKGLQLADAAISTEKRILLDDLERRVGELIDDLPEKEKAVLLMKKMGGMTYQAIGIMQGFSDRYAKKLVRKALDTISAVLEEEDYLKGGRLNYA